MNDINCLECGHLVEKHGVSGCFQRIPENKTLIHNGSCECEKTEHEIYRARIAQMHADLERDVIGNTLYMKFVAFRSYAYVVRLEQLLDAVAALPEKWKAEALQAVPPEYHDRDLDFKYMKLDNEAGGRYFCAEELPAALRPEEAG